MMTIPDAPWVREAEMYGIDGGGNRYVCCPVCEEECSDIWLDGDGNACGCNRCMRKKDAVEWMQDMIERSRPE
jgi:hypothetical protein